jgi:hypothetical protein
MTASPSSARLTGALAAIIADPDCCAVSKEIARAALSASGGELPAKSGEQNADNALLRAVHFSLVGMDWRVSDSELRGLTAELRRRGVVAFPSTNAIEQIEGDA